MQSTGLVTLTTDFGQSDGYVAIMKGVILTINSQAQTIDYTHEVDPQNIREAAYLIHTGYRYFPDGTVHLIVVDPGVGGDRKALALRTPRCSFVAPDNGVLTYVWFDALQTWGRDQIKLVELVEPRWWLPQVSATFHGRDIFAPVAAHLSNGVAITEFGPVLDTPVLLPAQQPEQRHDGSWIGRIVHVDRFGNCITNVSRAFLEAHGSLEQAQVSILDQQIDNWSRTYAESSYGSIMALIGSGDYMELAVRNGNAAKMLGVGAGDPLRITFQQAEVE